MDDNNYAIQHEIVKSKKTILTLTDNFHKIFNQLIITNNELISIQSNIKLKTKLKKKTHGKLLPSHTNTSIKVEALRLKH